MNTMFWLVIGIAIFFYLLDIIIDYLNLQHLSSAVPDEFSGVYDKQKYAKSQNYLAQRTYLHFVESTFSLIVLLVFIIWGGFNWLDLWLRSFQVSTLLTGVLYILILGLLAQVINLPFQLYSTFIIEERFGFNRTTLKTFILDLVKGLFLMLLIGVPLLAMILWFFTQAGNNAWLYAWGAIVIVQVILMYLAPAIIMPLFNKFEPLQDQDLDKAITAYASKQSFHLEGVYQMDGSKRSSKANAFFTGFGRFKRIVLFDTLIKQQSINELVAVLAHEIGHYKLGHIHKGLVLSIISTGLLFYCLSLMINNPYIFAAFKMEHVSIYASLVFLGFLYTPISKCTSMISAWFSRKYEFEADAYAARTHGNAEDLVSALKKLSVDSLSNLTPHPLKVFMEYSHPPVLERIKVLRSL